MSLLSLVKTLVSLLILFYTIKTVRLVKNIVSDLRQERKAKFLDEARKVIEVKSLEGDLNGE